MLYWHPAAIPHFLALELSMRPACFPELRSVSVPSGLAVKLSREMGLTLVGFLRGLRFVVYSHAERCLTAEGITDF